MIPSAYFFDLLDALYEPERERRAHGVRGLLAQLSAARTATLRAVSGLLRKIVASQAQVLKLGDAAAMFGPALVRQLLGWRFDARPI